MALRPYQQAAVDAAKAHMISCKSFCIIEAATGCHEKGHPILMADGHMKKVQQIKVGDFVMGPDSKPREVLKLHRGVDQFYKVTPIKGESFEVNKGHIFNFYKTPRAKNQNPEYFNASVSEFLTFNKTTKHRTKIQKTNINFKRNWVLPIDPWVLGILIGDGCLTTGPNFSNPDIEIVTKMSDYATKRGMMLSENKKKDTCSTYRFCNIKPSRTNPNRISMYLKFLKLYGKKSDQKFIHYIYKTASRENRLKLLAGLIDSDGSLSKSGYDWISKSQKLADDIVFVARSVGLAAYKRKCKKSCQGDFQGVYYRVSISGDCSIIPCEVERKKSPERKQIKNVLVTGFDLQKTSVKKYYGFELSGDHLYVDGFFNVHHNSGKSHIISALAEWVTENRKDKRCLCLAPSKELVEQNHQKYINAGFRASIYSASAGRKCLKNPVIFGTPLTILNSIKKIPKISLLIIDEAHGITPTIKKIINQLSMKHPNMRVLGLTATPYRRKEGYIYQCDENDVLTYDPEISKHKPYFVKKVFTIRAHELIAMGYLTPIQIGEASEHYDTSELEINSMGNYTTETVEKAFIGQGRLTAAIVADVVEKSAGRKGVILFASTVAHAKEILESLPEGSRLVIGDTEKTEREKAIKDFKAQKFKYLVNVGVLTTGFDAPHVDVVAVLRATDSAALFQQIIGRGLRLAENKTDCLLLDYAENIDRHSLEDDVFTPTIEGEVKKEEEQKTIDIECPTCGNFNKFKGMSKTNHFGRRCQSFVLNKDQKTLEQCTHRFEFKLCPSCESENDITARYCKECKEELIDPNEKLFFPFLKKEKYDFSKPTVLKVLNWQISKHISQAGNETVKINFITDDRHFILWFMPKAKTNWMQLCNAVYDGDPAPTVDDFLEAKEYAKMPRTITVKKKLGTKYFAIYGYNQPLPEPAI